MPYTANQYNYATPLSSATQFNGETSVVPDLKYLTLLGNKLDGTYYPIEGDVGLWGESVSDETGTLPEPFIVTVVEDLTVNAFRLVGSSYSYPVDFSIIFYSGSDTVYTIEETGNTLVEYKRYLPKTIECTGYTITVTKISAPGSVVQLYNSYNPAHVKRSDTLVARTAELSEQSILIELMKTDSLHIVTDEPTAIENIIDRTYDTLNVVLDESGKPINVHSVMKSPSRRIYGKVYITYTDPMLESETSVDTNMEAYNSVKEQVMDGTTETDGIYFTLYDNDLSGKYSVMTEQSQVGWVSGIVSDSDGRFAETPYLQLNFSPRPVTPLTIYFDTSHGSVVEEFDVVFRHEDGTSTIKSIVGNAAAQVLVMEETITSVVSVTINIIKTSKPNFPAVIIEVPVMSTILYEGYKDHSDLISIDLLEELTYDDNIEALGGVSANEVTVVIDNSDTAFYFNNRQSAVAGQLRRNRKIVPWLGAELEPGLVEWYKQGTYWSYSWKVPVNGLTATVVGFDTIGLLDTTSFYDHQVLVDKSIGELLEYVLEDAKSQLSFLTWKIDEALYDTVIPYAWFPSGSHTAALRKISQAYPMHIYCNKDGDICAAPQKLRLDYYYDTWSDSTNVISKEYSSLYTTLPNIINVTVNIPQLAAETNLVQDTLVFDIADTPTRTLNFSNPYMSDLVVTIDKDSSVSYTYEVFSWGISFVFSGYGKVRNISCVGTAIDISNTSTLTRRDENSIRLNGSSTRDVSADFIQTSSLASLIIDRIFTLSEHDKYDATVVYRGDIALSVNDPILLLNGIAPDNRYNIRRHQLSWNGALSGTADLNT